MTSTPIHTFALAFAAISISASAADWPMYRADAQRSNITDEELAFPLQPAWVYRAAQAPRPAWPEPGKNLNRMDFDYAPHPVIADGVLCFGSSADDSVRALDAKTGALKWRFVTGGPIRFAPQIWKGKVYVGSDDGILYCLDLQTGKSLWTFRGGLSDDRLLGNERMISRWPMRSGVLVHDDVLYTVAGMWPFEGVFIYALDPATGAIQWCNDTSGADYFRIVGHASELSLAGTNPQGALLATGDKLVLPMGRAAPASFDRRTGRLLAYAPGVANGCGGCWVALDGDHAYMYAKSFYSGLAVAGLPLDTMGSEEDERIRAHVPQISVYRSGWGYSTYEGRTSVIVRDGKVTGRRAYSLARAGRVLLVGQDGYVTAENPDAAAGDEPWRGVVRGQARELAVADGRLYVSTDAGEITCFAADGSHKAVAEKPAKGDTPRLSADDEKLLARIVDGGMDQGYALVVGDADARWSRLLAARTSLHIVNLQTGRTAAALRDRLLTTTRLYGSRIHVIAAEDGERLPLPRYFANVVVARGAPRGPAAKQLYRCLRPVGGLMLFPGAVAANVEPWLKSAEIAAEEIQRDADGIRVHRGSLPGAWDWNTGGTGDKLVRWPMRPTWFGGPGPDNFHNRKYREPTLAAADGRFYVNGDRVILAIDAYNGTVLWSRRIPFRPKGAGGNVSADDQYVYYKLGKNSIYQLDAKTGRQDAIFAPYVPGEVLSLTKPDRWPMTLTRDEKGAPVAPGSERRAGVVSLAKDGKSVRLTLATDNLPTHRTAEWHVFLDRRPPSRRYGLYGPETLDLLVSPAGPNGATATVTAVSGSAPESMTVAGEWEDDRTTTTLQFASEALASGTSPSFGFAVILRRGDANKKTVPLEARLFCKGDANGLNNGWATVFLDAAGAVERPAVMVGADEPDDFLDDETTIAQPPTASLKPKPGQMNAATAATRVHPLTGQQVQKFRVRGDGCSGIALSDSSIMYRAGNVGIYDFEDDSGVRVLAGMRPSCGKSTMAAHGIWYVSNGGSGCECTYNFLANMGLAHTDRRSHEDWALFTEVSPDTIVRHAYLNLGAPGDRRDEDRALWLGFPRHEAHVSGTLLPYSATYKGMRGVWLQGMSSSMDVPMEVETVEGFGAHRVHADRIAIANTERPWLYASRYVGIRRARMTLNFMSPLAARRADAPIVVDGRTDEATWPRVPQATLPATGSAVRFAFDDDNLYIAGFRPVSEKRKSWDTKAVKRDNAQAFYFKDAWEVFVSDATNQAVLHLAVTAGGTQLDARAKGTHREDLRWNAEWQCAVAPGEDGFGAEFAIPMELLRSEGLDTNALAVNVLVGHHKNVAESIVRLGAKGRARCGSFVPLWLRDPPPPVTRAYTVRLHFAELDELEPGERVFDIAIQGKRVLENFDVVREAGGPRRALVREFTNVQAHDDLTLEFFPRRDDGSAAAEPILNAIEIVQEGLEEHARTD